MANNVAAAFGQVGITPQTSNNMPTSGTGPSILDQVSNVRPKQGKRIVIGGLEKMGKTRLAADGPRTMLVTLEIGAEEVNVPKTPLLSHWWQVLQFLDEVRASCEAGTFAAFTLAWDTLTALERIMHAETIRVDNKGRQSMETAHGGYGKAYAYANGLMSDFMEKCDYLASKFGINHIFTCHIFPAKQVDPAFGEYDQWDLLLHSPKNNKTYGKREMITQWADLVGIITEPFFITQGEGETLQRGVTRNNGRVLVVSRTPAYVAGNRFGLTGEIPIPDPTRNQYGTAWNTLADAIYQSSGVDLYNRD